MVRTNRRNPRASKTLTAKIKSVVKRQIETKRTNLVIDNVLANGGGVGISTTPFYIPILDLTSLRQGTASNEYVGAEIRLQYLKCRGSVQQADSRNLVRVMLLRARSNFKFQVGDTEPFLTQDYPLYSSINPKFVAQVYFDRIYNMNAASGDDNELRYVRKNFNLKNQLIRVIAQDVYSSELYWVVVSDSSVATHPGFLMNMELSWKDA